MGWFGFLLLILVIGGMIYLYQKLVSIEQEIREEHSRARTVPQDDAADKVVKPEVAPPIFQELVKLEPDESDSGDSPPLSLENGLLKVISELPGLLQTELYGLFPGEERKRLQSLLLRLDRDGVIKREKKNSSYRVFPV